MNNLSDKITADWKESVKNKDVSRKQILVMARAAIQNEEIQKRGEKLSDDQVQAVLKRMVKQVNESLDTIKGSGTDEQKSTLLKEIGVLKDYLPVQLSEDDVRDRVQNILGLGEHTKSKFGLAMKDVMSDLKGQTDGKLVQAIVKELLG